VVEKLKISLNAAQDKACPGVYAPRAGLNAVRGEANKAEKEPADLNAALLKKEAEAEVTAAIKAGKIPPAAKGACPDLCPAEDGLKKKSKALSWCRP